VLRQVCALLCSCFHRGVLLGQALLGLTWCSRARTLEMCRPAAAELGPLKCVHEQSVHGSRFVAQFRPLMYACLHACTLHGHLCHFKHCSNP
jgi:hypothetical protein